MPTTGDNHQAKRRDGYGRLVSKGVITERVPALAADPGRRIW